MKPERPRIGTPPHSPTISPADAISSEWDVIVVGAGVAGTVAASLAAQAGRSVLLLDKESFPREKTCGGCLSHRGVATLARLGWDVAAIPGAMPIGGAAFFSAQGRRRLAFSPPLGPLAVSRSTLDAWLVGEAIRRGVHFLAGVRVASSRLEDDRRVVQARHGEQMLALSASIVVAAAGLLDPLARAEDLLVPPPHWSRDKIGVSGTIAMPQPAPDWIVENHVNMALGRGGYVGFVQIENGLWNAAAALEPHLAGSGATAEAIEGLLRSAGLDAEPLHGPIRDVTWTACPRLHRSLRRAWAERMLVVGDAAGYIEPLTGEGMAWAIASAEAAAPVLASQWTADSGPRYSQHWRRQIGRRRLLARLAPAMAERPRMFNTALTALRWPFVDRLLP